MSSWRLVYAFLSFVCYSTLSLASFVNGQTFTNGLAIIDAPSPNSPGHAGSNLPVAVDVSGDGQIPVAASIPGSGRSTAFNSLTIYLVSSETNINLTVSNNSSFLAGEAQSTVKHLNWPIPTCVPAGNYNLTFYEASVFNSAPVFAITPILVQIQNPNPSGQCSDLNTLLPQPQPANPLSQSPFSPDFTLTLTLSNGVLNLPTVTVTSQGTPTTVVLISETTVTATEQGTPTTYTQTATLTTVVSLPSNAQDTSGFVPVNAGMHLYPSVFGLCASALLYWRIIL
ncbi:hypothetical protein C8F01DRAFT_422781 [Mycena amicta]|nr:hypothetical protein C8F01DRAFT_422781 [Mycena amicta]